MKRTRFAKRGGLNRDAENLVRLAIALSKSASRTEDSYWERRLIEAVDRLLGGSNDAPLNAALDELHGSNAAAYGELADVVEARAESSSLSHDEIARDALLLAVPVLAWSRYAIPTGAVPDALLQSLRVQLQAHVLAAGASLGIADMLFSPDQLPQGFSETRALTEQLAVASLGGSDLPIDARRLPETSPFLSDMRYLLAAVSAPSGQPLFRWQESDGSHEQSLGRWREQGGASMQQLLAGCSYELVGPNAYHWACRESDRQLRPYSLRASVAFLQLTLDIDPTGLRAIIAPFAERRVEEYRIAFAAKSSGDVLHGVVWPLLDSEDESSETAGGIETILQEAGLSDIVVLEHQFPLEYCDDCGAPLYPDGEGHAVHAELPEDAEASPGPLH